MSDLTDKLDALGSLPCERGTGTLYDRRLYELVEELVREVERLNARLDLTLAIAQQAEHDSMGSRVIG